MRPGVPAKNVLTETYMNRFYSALQNLPTRWGEFSIRIEDTTILNDDSIIVQAICKESRSRQPVALTVRLSDGGLTREEFPPETASYDGIIELINGHLLLWFTDGGEYNRRLLGKRRRQVRSLRCDRVTFHRRTGQNSLS